MDIGKAFTFIKDDEKWLEKIGIGIGLVIFSFLILPVMILSGYAVRLLQNVRDGQADPLPDWDDWSGDLARGFKLWVIQLIWAIPLILFSVPTSIGSAIASGKNAGEFGEFVGGSLMICASCLMLLYGLFVALATPGYTISFAKDEKIGSGLQLTTIWGWTQANLGQVIIATLVILAGGFIVTAVAGIVGIILCGIGLILTIPLASVVVIFFQHHLYGQLAYEHPMYGSRAAVSPAATKSQAPIVPPAIVPGAETVVDEPPTPIVDEVRDMPVDAEPAVDQPVDDEPADDGAEAPEADDNSETPS